MFQWFTNVFWNLFYSIGLFQKKANCLFLGLDNAGKTTLLRYMCTGRISAAPPTAHANHEELQVNNVNIRAIDVGGHVQARRLWRDFFMSANAIIYMIDVSDPERFTESKAELDALLTCEDAAKIPVLVLGNKIDSREAVSEEHVRQFFNLYDSDLAPRPMRLFMVSVLYGQGFKEGFEWLTRHV